MSPFAFGLNILPKSFQIWIVKFLILGLGVIFLISSLSLIYDNYQFLSSAKLTVGKVKSLTSYNDDDVFRPSVGFITDRGENISFVSDIGTNFNLYQINDQIEVLYNPSYPKEAKINSWIDLWLVPIILMFIGILLLVVFKYFRFAKIRL